MISRRQSGVLRLKRIVPVSGRVLLVKCSASIGSKELSQVSLSSASWEIPSRESLSTDRRGGRGPHKTRVATLGSSAGREGPREGLGSSEHQRTTTISKLHSHLAQRSPRPP